MSSSPDLYNYNPSTGAAIAFAIFFFITAGGHVWQMYRNKSWFFIPFIIGGLFEIFGYAARYDSAKQTPNWTVMPYAAQELFLLLAPSLFAASIYMILGRIIQLLNGASNSLVRPSWLTKIFVTGDVVSFLMQCGGGGMLSSAKTESTMKLGQNVIVAGLIVQIISFGFFIVVSAVFHRRMLKTPMHFMIETSFPWTRYMIVLYSASALIMVRSIYRVAEYVQGSTGFLQSKEALVYIFDGSLMLICCILFNVFHPSKILSKSPDRPNEDVEMLNDETGYGNCP